MAAESPELISHIPNSGIVHMPGRRFPGIVMQSDTLFTLLAGIRELLVEFKRLGDEERYYETLLIGESLQAQLEHYEDALASRGMTLPYPGSVRDNPIEDDFDAKEQ